MHKFLVLLLAANAAAFLVLSSPPEGTLSGTISGHRGPLAGTVVRATNLQTGAAHEIRTAADGTYKLTLPAGSYDLFATPVGFAPFAKHNVVLAAGATLRIDALLNDHPNEGTPGELAYLHFRDEHQAPKGPAPRTRDGRPDLSGVWYPSPDLEPEDPPFLPWAAEYARTHGVAEDPRAQCLPSGVARGQQNELSKLIQTPTEIVMLVEGAPPGFRQIFLDGRIHPTNLEPSWMGHSVGHWEWEQNERTGRPKASSVVRDETLVVDTVGFNNRAWIDFNRTPQTEKLHITERYRRLDLGHLDLVITIDDPGAYSRPWKMHRILTLAASEEIQEYICNENNVTQHLVH